MAEDRSELKSSRKRLGCSLILANVNDDRNGGSTDIAEEE